MTRSGVQHEDSEVSKIAVAIIMSLLSIAA